MGCTQERGENYSDSKFIIESEIRKWEMGLEISSKVFIDIVYEINSKIHLEGEYMNLEKFDNFFIRNFSKRDSKYLFDHEYYKLSKEKYDTLKIKNLLFVMTQSKKIVTRKGVYYYDKANYLFNYVKDCDGDKDDCIKRNSIGFESFIKELVEISFQILPGMWKEQKDEPLKNVSKNEEELLFNSNDKINMIKENLINKIFDYETNSDKEKITIHNLNEIYESNLYFLTSGFIREFALNLLKDN